MLQNLFARDIFAEMDRLTRELTQAFDLTPAIRGLARGFPAVNVGGTADSVEIYAFAPGVDPSKVEVTLDNGVLTISGERSPAIPADDKNTVHINERYAGRYRRVISLPDDVDPNAVQAQYRNGVLHVSVKRRASVRPQRITVQ